MPHNTTARASTLLLLSVSVTAIGCATTTPLTPASAATLKGREVTISKRPAPDFVASTPGKAMFGLIGALAAISAGNDIVNNNGVEDPAPLIGRELSVELARRYGTAVSPNRILVIKDDDDAVTSPSASRADLVLDVSTIGWSFIYFPFSWDHYRVLYNARLRLIDRRTAQVVAEGHCSRVPEETPTAPSYDQLLANRAQRLKDELRTAAQICAGQLRDQVLSWR